MKKHPLTTITVLGLLLTGLVFAIGWHYVSKDAPAPKETQTITEDDPRWNCLTMGNRKCGPDYKPVPKGLAEALYEGVDTKEDWTKCLVNFGDTTVIVCPDGRVETS
jgi:hypothetical protein